MLPFLVCTITVYSPKLNNVLHMVNMLHSRCVAKLVLVPHDICQLYWRLYRKVALMAFEQVRVQWRDFDWIWIKRLKLRDWSTHDFAPHGTCAPDMYLGCSNCWKWLFRPSIINSGRNNFSFSFTGRDINFQILTDISYLNNINVSTPDNNQPFGKHRIHMARIHAHNEQWLLIMQYLY